MRINRLLLTNGSTRFSIEPDFADGSVNLLDNDGVTPIDLEIKSLRLTGGLTLLSATTGTPSSNANIRVERGASTDAELSWNETTDDWQAGLVGATRAIVRRLQQDITNANLSGGNYTLAHNFGKYPIIQVISDSSLGNALVGMTVTHTDTNNCVINFSQVLVSSLLVGTWRIIAES